MSAADIDTHAGQLSRGQASQKVNRQHWLRAVTWKDKAWLAELWDPHWPHDRHHGQVVAPQSHGICGLQALQLVTLAIELPAGQATDLLSGRLLLDDPAAWQSLNRCEQLNFDARASNLAALRSHSSQLQHIRISRL